MISDTMAKHSKSEILNSKQAQMFKALIVMMFYTFENLNFKVV